MKIKFIVVIVTPILYVCTLGAQNRLYEQPDTRASQSNLGDDLEDRKSEFTGAEINGSLKEIKSATVYSAVIYFEKYEDHPMPYNEIGKVMDGTARFDPSANPEIKDQKVKDVVAKELNLSNPKPEIQRLGKGRFVIPIKMNNDVTGPGNVNSSNYDGRQQMFIMVNIEMPQKSSEEEFTQVAIVQNEASFGSTNGMATAIMGANDSPKDMMNQARKWIAAEGKNAYYQTVFDSAVRLSKVRNDIIFPEPLVKTN